MLEALLDDLRDPWEQSDFENWVRNNNNIVKRMHAHTAGNVFLVVTALIDLAYLIVSRQNKWLAAGTLICFAVFLLLPICFPAYYSIVPRRYGVHGQRSLRYCLGAGLFIHAFIMWMRTISDFSFTFWLDALLLSGVFAFLITGVMILLAKEFRVKNRVRAGFLVLMLFFSLGVVGQANYLLDFAPPRTELSEITEVDFFAGNPTRNVFYEFFRYECTVELEDGSEATFNVPFSQTDGMWVGNKIGVEYHNGGLGLEYASIKTVPDLEPR